MFASDWYIAMVTQLWTHTEWIWYPAAGLLLPF